MPRTEFTPKEIADKLSVSTERIPGVLFMFGGRITLKQRFALVNLLLLPDEPLNKLATLSGLGLAQFRLEITRGLSALMIGVSNARPVDNPIIDVMVLDPALYFTNELDSRERVRADTFDRIHGYVRELRIGTMQAFLGRGKKSLADHPGIAEQTLLTVDQMLRLCALEFPARNSST